MSSSDAHILILGLGNTLLSDEAVGVRVVEFIGELPDGEIEGVRLLDGGTMGLSLLVDIEDAAALIVVDAAHIDGAPGSIEVFEGQEMDDFLRRRGRSPHDIGFDDIMDALRLLEAVPEKRALVAIRPADLGVGEALTTDVAHAVPRAAEKIVGLVARWT